MTNKEFAERLVNLIEKHKHATCDGKSGPINAGYAQAHEHIIEIINVQASFLPDENEPLVKWLPQKVDNTHYYYYCGNCNFRSKYFKSKYCPECGKKMDV